jgi:F-box and WD-40 domain protein 1/11
VVERLNPILHMDPVVKLPPEITWEIFSYLEPRTLLNATLASRSWRDRILDSGLWKFLYIAEGWRMDVPAIRAFEQEHFEPISPQTRKSRLRHSEPDLGEPKHKKRVPPTWLDSRSAEYQGPTVLGAAPEADDEGDHLMTDDDDRAADSFADDSNSALPNSLSPHHSPLYPPLQSSLLMRSPNGSAKVNWTHLYKQRRRLEANWHHGRYTNFQLPDPSYPDEAHRECVYAIQFEGKWLVSGSRDRTVRVWNLDTKRLWLPPLTGHVKSVLCLQFDPRPEEDVIISGSSDRTVIIWKFSTGEMIHQITKAHADSVLNLKFDHRYLVTCSKDRTVKVWNRRDLLPNNKDYPRVCRGAGATYPSYIIDLKETAPSMLEAGIANDQIKALVPYTLLMTVEGHGAAVNAMQIHGDDIVTASGDRMIKVWNIRTGACSKTLMGHEKGIACVEFDSRRIISGSNDNTVRVYDHISGAEVACLRGHSNLVRTLQAGFGDPPGADETLRQEAQAVENEFFAAQEAGQPVELGHREQRLNGYQTNTAGSRDPRDITALGAKIPPGGGGSNWARIVSGSYDESILIWHKDRDGKWTTAHQLKQHDAIANAARANLSQVARTTVAAQAQQLQAAQVLMTLPGTQTGGQIANANAANAQAGPANQNNQAQAVPPAVTNVQLPNPPAVHHHHHHVHPRRPPLIPQPTARVFKLQFDSRKIICASVDPRIVGWDFANDDEEIIDACPFFQGL